MRAKLFKCVNAFGVSPGKLLHPVSLVEGIGYVKRNFPIVRRSPVTLEEVPSVKKNCIPPDAERQQRMPGAAEAESADTVQPGAWVETLRIELPLDQRGALPSGLFLPPGTARKVSRVVSVAPVCKIP